MKNKLLVLTAIIASFATTNAVTIRENVVKLKGISNAEYNIQDENYFVTKNQPYNKRLEIENIDKGVKITFESGRKKSKEVVTRLKSYLFSQGIPLKGIAYSGYIRPKKLNFAFSGELSFDKSGKRYRCENISLAQERDYVVNRWWFFTNIKKPKYNYNREAIQFNCSAKGNEVSFYAFRDGTVNEFSIIDYDS